MSKEGSEYVVDEANAERLTVWLKAGQWTREEATDLFLEIRPRSVTYECFATFSGRGEVQYSFYDEDGKDKEPCSYDENDEPEYLTAEQDALFHKTMVRRFEIDLQLNSLVSARPQEWIELACEKGIKIPWLDWAIKSVPSIQSQEPNAVSNVPVVAGAESNPTQQLDLLATPEELIDAFGSFTGMNKAWFKKPQDKPQLKAALRRAGVSGRGGTKPLFDVFTVMKWLIHPKRKTGTKMSEIAGWRRLKAKFPEIYKHYQDYAPDPDDRG
jgi:hypothetical protein